MPLEQTGTADERRLQRRIWFVSALLLTALVLLLLSGPASFWLQCRNRAWLHPQPPDAVYLMGGAKAQNRRIAILVNFIQPWTSVTNAETAPLILIGNDTTKGPWCRAEQTNLCMAAWAQKKLANRLGNAIRLTVVPGRPITTDTEMELLADFLAKQPAIRTLVIVTSPFHMRRALRRLEKHLQTPLVVCSAPATPDWHDRAPWVVAAELLKMARDAVGMSRAPFLSRRARESESAQRGSISTTLGLTPAASEAIILGT